MTIADILLIAFGLIAIGAALAVVTTSRIVRAGLWLAVSFAGVAASVLVMTAELLAWVLVLIYVGAIVVLLLFATMLTQAPTDASAQMDRNRWPGVIIAAGVGLGLGAVFTGAIGWSRVDLAGVEPGSPAVLGEQIFAHWVLPFELLSLLLLSALIGSVMIATQGTRKRVD
ncbi:NADH-quinone oxidoreductase subunit J family protein [Natronoglycomyces albus]|uniref:NADH-quinone oxidoreductase subunit J n=1 Tax=Natronoglycomyces albus TaxID=2811108 RepID=A0A895XQW2_9ACTN|nr:NADH-quinone oxidoreductase subunit J [Natronoglycomyces albus]QSB04946.1 NADH-quinone oxidoreductase subunit J [Natronoglycomyces albus]